MISGGGKVGSFLANRLGKEGHTVVIIEKDPETCEKLSTFIPGIVINGDGCDYRFQEEARMERADVFAAVTGDDDDNLVACQLAKVSFNVPRTVARVNNPKNERIFNLMGIAAISSTTVIGHLIQEESTVGDIVTLQLLKNGKVAIIELDIPATGARSIGKAIKDIEIPEGCLLVSIVRGEEVIVPKGGVVIMPEDSIIAVSSVDKEKDLKKALTG